MDASTRLTLTLAASTAAFLGTAWIFVVVRRRRRRSPEEVERQRRLDVNRRGRIASGEILDVVEAEPGNPGARLVTYRYNATGVTFNAAQDLSALPSVLALVRRRVGRTVSVKYDPRLPANSILACEEWSGVPQTENQKSSGPSSLPSSAGMAENS